MSTVYELAIIGAGPAGIEAALTASELGVATVLIDRAPAAGGQYFHALPGSFRAARPTAVEHEGQALASRLDGSSVTRVLNAAVWGLFQEETSDGWMITLEAGGEALKVHARNVILATGAYDTPVPFPGWTLPGVLTCGAALHLLKTQRVAPFKRVLVSGTGPLLLSVGAHLAAAGVEVVNICESNRLSAGVLGHLPTLLREGQRLQEGLGYLTTLVRTRTPYSTGTSVVAVRGQDRVEEATYARLTADGAPIHDTQRTVDVDAVICGYGFTPQTGLARMIGCRFEFNAATDTWLPWRDPDLRSDQPGVYLAGDGASIGGAAHSRLEGQLAAVAVAVATGHLDPAGAETRKQALHGALAQQRRFAGFLSTFYSPQLGLHDLAQPDTLVCRCEEVTRAEVDAAVADGAQTLGEVKAVTRCGMGNCQGRMCERALIGAIRRARAGQGEALPPIGMYAIRPPLYPLPVGFLIKAGQQE